MKMKSVILILLFLLSASAGTDNLFQQFRNPPSEARPFVRWWWNGDCVEKQEIVRELDLLKAAGIGGVEINPIAMPKYAPKTSSKCLTWGSPEWNRIVKKTIKAAHQRNMLVDMIVGTGWPFGGKFLLPEEQIQGVILDVVEVTGPKIMEGNLFGYLKNVKNFRRYETDSDQSAPKPELVFVRLVPKNIQNLNDIFDVTDQVKQDWNFRFNIPPGEHLLTIGTLNRGTGFRVVTHGAPGGDGPSLDHYNRTAVEKYVNRLSDRLAPLVGGKLGKALRALFVDSIELAGSNWTGGILEKFRRTFGYDLTPYYPFIFYQDPWKGYQDSFTLQGTLGDTIQRVRYDFSKFLVDQFLENFVRTFNDWCHQQEALSRYQAYGSPWLMGMGDGYLIPDIPESNNWLFSPNAYTHGYYVWNKYTSSGGHLKNRPIISCEAMTNTRGVFAATLDMIKSADDMNFIMGITHSVLHGFNYSPPEAGFPGWVRYGTYFNEQNTWWPYLPKWVEYNARLSAVFQASRPLVEVAILNPEADLWSTSGLYRVPFHLQPWYCQRLWEAFSHLGGSADYVTESVLQSATFEDGLLHYGSMKYKLLILAGVKSLLPETARALERFAAAGGKIVLVGETPHRSPSLQNAAENDRTVQNAIGAALQQSDAVLHMTAPPEGTDLINWTRKMLERIQIRLALSIRNPNPDVYQVYRRFADKDIFFFANKSPEKEQEVDAIFPAGEKIPWKWDPETGNRTPLSFQGKRHHLDFRLQPHQSLLVVFEPNIAGKPIRQNEPQLKRQKIITAGWRCTFHPVRGKPFVRTMNKLVDLHLSDDPALANFAGSVIYETKFNLAKIQPIQLNLGKVFNISEVTVNNQPAGVRWYGNHVYSLDYQLKKGENHLKVKVTTVLLNYMKSLKENKTAMHWTAKQQSVSTGMVGPVKLFFAK